MFEVPPPMLLSMPSAKLELPPLTVAAVRATLPEPPPIVARKSPATFEVPPPIVVQNAVAWLPEPPATVEKPPVAWLAQSGHSVPSPSCDDPPPDTTEPTPLARFPAAPSAMLGASTNSLPAGVGMKRAMRDDSTRSSSACASVVPRKFVVGLVPALPLRDQPVQSQPKPRES